jgi:hypothetical protein
MLNFWSKKEDERLLELSALGYTSLQIAADLKRSHSSINTRRMRLKKQGHTLDKVVIRSGSEYAMQLKGGGVFTPKPAREYNYERPEGTYDLTELRENMCKFPMTDTLPYYFCGKKIHRGSYCEECAKKCFK